MNALSSARATLRRALNHNHTNLVRIADAIKTSPNHLDRFKNGDTPEQVWGQNPSTFLPMMQRLTDEIFAGARIYDHANDDFTSTNTAEPMPQGVMMAAPNGSQLSPQSDLDVGRGFVVVHAAKGDSSVTGMPRDD